MKKTILACALAAAPLVQAQIGKTFDWHTAAGDAQRSGWEHSDTKFVKEDVKNFKLVFKTKLLGREPASTLLFPPIVFDTVIGGFKELAFVANGSGDIFALDVDLNRVYWQRHINLPKVSVTSENCSVGVTSEPTMEGKGGNALYVLAVDGKLYRLDTSTGEDSQPPINVMPAGANVANLNADDGVVYAATSYGCGGAPNAVWAIDLNGDKPKVTSFPSPAPEGFVGRNGVLLGSGGEIYAESTNTVQVLSPKDLQPQQTFSGALGNTSPVVFRYKNHDLLVTVAKSGRLYLLDTKAMRLARFETEPLSAEGDVGIVGLATWETGGGTRWVLAALAGEQGSVVAFRLMEDGPQLVLTKAWSSAAISMPETPVIANGVVFVLSAGELGRKGKLRGHATLHALDGQTGKELWQSGDRVTAPANPGGLTVANGRVYFSTTDSTFYGFGIFGAWWSHRYADGSLIDCLMIGIHQFDLDFMGPG